MENVKLREKSPRPDSNRKEKIIEEEFQEPVSINQCRQSFTEYHLRPATPADAGSSSEQLDKLSTGSYSDYSPISSGIGSPSEGGARTPTSALLSLSLEDERTPSIVGLVRKLPGSKADEDISHPNILIHHPSLTNYDENSEDVAADAEVQSICENADKQHSPSPSLSVGSALNISQENLVPVNYEQEVYEISDTENEDKGLQSGAAENFGSPAISMTSPRAKSPRPVTPKKDEKDESFWDKFGTIGRKKRMKEVQAFEEEGKNAIDSPGSPMSFDIPPEEYDLAEGEERSLIERRSYADPKLLQLMNLLIDWINDELADQRIIVKRIEDDLYDGQVLQKLLEKLTGQKLEVTEVTQSEEGQRQKLQIVLGAANQVLGFPRWSQSKWSVDSIHSKSLVAILYLLVHLVRHFRAPLRLPENVNVETVVVKKKNAKLEYRRVTEEITSTYDEFGMRCERDAFDALLDHAPDKLQVVKKSLVTFVNKHLNKINLEVSDIDNQFHDGVYLTLLMGLLEGYFVPLFEFHLTPKDFEQKVYNVSFAFELMQDAGLSKPKARPEDIVNLDLKSTLRVLYNLFAKYKNLG